jgi:integrase
VNKLNASSKIEQYIQAATRDNTRLSYQAAITHYEVSWGGLLPATADNVARYLADHAESHAISTLKQRLSAIASWHNEQGFPDPTKAPIVKRVLKGIRALHPKQEKQAKPIQLVTLEAVDGYLVDQIDIAKHAEDTTHLLAHLRNRALVLIGFWRAFRSDELCRLNVENIKIVRGEGMTFYLPRTKTEHSEHGVTYHAPMLSKLCPVNAYLEWINYAGLTNGPVFRKISHWGQVSDKPMNPRSIVPLIRKLFTQADIEQAADYSSHSFRRGFASWASENDWDLKSLMSYVGWKNIQSAIKYLDKDDQFGQKRIESKL